MIVIRTLPRIRGVLLPQNHKLVETHIFEVEYWDEYLNLSPALSKNQPVVSWADKETQTEFIEAISLENGSNSSPVQSREDSPLHQITCSLCKYKHSYQYQASKYWLDTVGMALFRALSVDSGK